MTVCMHTPIAERRRKERAGPLPRCLRSSDDLKLGYVASFLRRRSDDSHAGRHLASALVMLDDCILIDFDEVEQKWILFAVVGNEAAQAAHVCNFPLAVWRLA